ncbi:nucleoside diphosphate kinase regulator [Hymenobacter koreensis]|uniref:Nucleoside diphosphate kinase regulator n=1 Tax=Hymenobacter koreensis TaxID=1084523 RepID=A0ABP8J2H3_9BACT
MDASYHRNPIYITRVDYDRLTQLVQLERQVHGNGRVAGLSYELKRAQLVDSHDILPDVVTMNSRVKLRDMSSNKELEITLAYPKFADINNRKISILAPVATAVLGCRVGDVVEWPVPNGNATYLVEKVLHQPEAAGDWVS